MHERLRTSLPALNGYLIPQSSRLFYATEILAAVMVVTGRDSVQLNSNEDTSETSLRLEDILRVAETIDLAAGHQVSESELKSALGTSIFTDRGADRFGFVHRTMAECLAARRFAQLDLRQLKPLFFQGDSINRHIVPQLAQTASWLSETHHEFFESVLECDVEVLLRAEVSNISDVHRDRIVVLLLQRVRSGELGFGRQLYLGGLKHPNIVQQLKHALLDPESGLAERALALDIAEACRLEELSAILFGAIENTQTAPILLPRIADTLTAIHGSHPEVLLTLLKPEILSRDTDFRVRGKALDTLVPGTLSVEEAFKYLEAPVEDAINAYSNFLNSKLPRLISREVIPAFFRFLDSKDPWATLGSPFRSLGESVFAAALHHLDDSQIAELTAAEWLRVVNETYGWSLRATPQISDVLAGSPDIRQKLAATVIRLLSQRGGLTPGGAFSLWEGIFPILREDDLLWLLDFLTHCPANEFTTAGVIFVAGFRWFSLHFFAKHSDAIIAAYNDVPQINQLLNEDLRPWSLEEPLSQKAKEQYKLEAEFQNKVQQEKKVPWRDVVHRLLQHLELDPNVWVQLDQVLTYDDEWKKSPSATPNDIPIGWSRLSESEQARAIAGARTFLITLKPHTTKPGEFTNYSQAGYTAATLLLEQIEQDSALMTAIRGKWIRTIVQHWSGNGSISRRALLVICMRADRTQTLDLLREVVMHEATTGVGALTAIDGIEGIVDGAVAEMLWECGTARNIKAEAIRRLIVFLSKYSWEEINQKLAPVVNNTMSLEADQRLAILATVFRVRPVQSWDVIWAAIEGDAKLARSILTDLAFYHEYGDESGLGELSESKLIAFYRKLAEIFPIEDDPSMLGGPQSREPEPNDTLSRERIAEFRREILRILGSRDSQAGCDALALLASEFEQSRSQIQWYLRRSLERWRMKIWNPPTIADVTRLLLDPSALSP